MLELESSNRFDTLEELEIFLESEFIPNKIVQRENKENETFLYVWASDLELLNLSEEELEYTIEYLKHQDIDIHGTLYSYTNKSSNYKNKPQITKDYPSEQIDYKEITNMVKEYQRTGNKDLKDKIIYNYIDLVKYLAARYSTYTKIKNEELESYGYEHLILAIDKFNPDFKNSFSSYAYSCIKYGISNEIVKFHNFKNPNTFWSYHYTKYEIKNQSKESLDENPNLMEKIFCRMEEKGKLPSKNNIFGQESRTSIHLLNSISMDDIDEKTYYDDTTLYHQTLDTMFQENVREMLLQEMEKYLTKNEYITLLLYYGFYDGECKTEVEIGNILNLTHQRIGQIRHKALRTLRKFSSLKCFCEMDIDEYCDNPKEIVYRKK